MEYTTDYLESLRPELVAYANQRFESAVLYIKNMAERVMIDMDTGNNYFYIPDIDEASPCPDIQYHLSLSSSSQEKISFSGWMYNLSLPRDVTYSGYLSRKYGSTSFELELIGEHEVDDRLIAHFYITDTRVYAPIPNAFIDTIFFYLIFSNRDNDNDVLHLCMELIGAFADFVQTNIPKQIRQLIRDYY